MANSKERKKIISELLHVTDEEFSDEELIRRLTMTEITEGSNKKGKAFFGATCGRCSCTFCRQLGIHIQFYRCNGCVDGGERHFGCQRI